MSENINSSLEVLSDASIMIDDLERDIYRFFKSDPYQRFIEHDANRRTDTHKIKLIREIPALFRNKTRHIASDIRSSLDNIGYAASVATGKLNPSKTYFPFASAESEASNIRERNCRDFPQEIFDVFWSFEPFLGGDEILWALNEIANCNKHRSVVPVGHGLDGRQIIQDYSCDGLCHSMAFPPTWDSSKNEMILFVVDSAANTDYNIHLGFDICFEDINVLRGHSTLIALKHLCSLAKSIAHSAHAEGMRIGIFN